jgi:hypothetical protein
MLSFLTSGATPDDIKLRANQTNIANLASFLSGQTPTSQFASISGAQSGAVPFAGGQQLPTLNPNAGQQGAQYALGSTQAAQNAFKLNQAKPNPWTTGLSGALKTAQMAGTAWDS